MAHAIMALSRGILKNSGLCGRDGFKPVVFKTQNTKVEYGNLLGG